LTAAQQTILKKSKYIENFEQKFFLIKQGANFSQGIKKLPAELTIEMMSQPPTEIKPINTSANGKPPIAGALHPLMKMRSAFIDILVSMGFKQMVTDKYVESSFWNFDSLI
jgi:phenylalanyl-tRNA synthetase alpha chain